MNCGRADAFVHKQQETAGERKECERVREECPVAAIGDNG